MLKKIAWNTVVQLIGKALAVVVSLITTGILTRKLGAVVYGQYILITSISIFFDALADFGTSIIGVREAAKEENEEGRVKVWSNVAILRLLMAFFSLSLGVILIYSWPDLKEIRIETLLAWSMMVFTSLAGSLGIVWQTRIKMETKVIVEVLFPTVFLLCLWRYKGEISLIWVFGTYLVARIVTLAGGWWAARGTINFRLLDKKLIRELVKMSWPMGVYLLVFSAYDRAIDSMMIRRFFGSSEVAWYGLAYKIYGTLIQPAYFLVIGIFPMLSKPFPNPSLDRAGREEKSNQKDRVFNLAAIVLLLSGITVMLGVWIFAPLMVQILAGSQFGASVGVLRTLAVALLFAYLGHLVGFTLISKEGQRAMLALGALVMVFNFVGNLVAIPYFGIMGAAVVTVLTEALSLILMSWKLKQIWK
ncbi:MAG: oligosaccharide flippase family protein [Candidatus Shapirobacteria bacterium]|jgi:O-antigen/teichoic acid export membrane protein